MNKRAVPARKVACQAVFAVGCFVFVELAGVRSARAESPRKVQGFEVLGTLGYGVVVGDLSWNYRGRDYVEFNPFGVMLGLDIGYTFPFGLRIGADASWGFGGRSKEQTLSTGEVVSPHASSFPWGGSIGYDFLVSSFRLRGAVDAGLAMFEVEGRPGAMYYIGPKVALIWQYRAFELGLQSKFWVMTDEHAAVQVGLMSGARLF